MGQRPEYDIIIIGAGIGGLAAGNILAKNGMKVLILEKNYAPGGGVGTFYRNGFPVDISHALCALKEGACLRKMFEYLGIDKKLEFIEQEKSFIFIREDKKPIFCYSDFHRYAEELRAYFPDEIGKIKRLFKEIVITWKSEVLKSYYNPSLLRLLLYPILFPRLLKYRFDTFDRFLNRFKLSTGLKEVISVGWPYIGMEPERVSALYMICMMGAYHHDKTYFIQGGFGKLNDALVERFKEQGGQLIYNTEVEKILLDARKTACGVRDKKGNTYQAKTIVSNADGKKTFLELLDSGVLPQEYLNKVEKSVMTRPAVQVHIFAEADIDQKYLSCGSILLPFHVDLEAKLRAALNLSQPAYAKPVLILSLHSLENFTPTSPKNTYAFNICWYPADYRLWKDYFEKFGKEEYERVKKKIGEAVLAEIDKVWLVKSLKSIHVMTPLSLEKWLNATEGAIYDLATTPDQVLLNRPKHKTPIKNLYLVGTKTFPGNGIAGALFSAFALGDILLKGKLSKGKMLT